jgi:hypothetical protein
MSAQARQEVCDWFRSITDGQRADLMDDTLTTTELIEFLQELFLARDGVWKGLIDCLAVRSDHPTYDGPNGHSGGNAIDIWNGDARQHLIEDTQACLDARGIGLGGLFQAYADACGGYSESSKLFEDNFSDHLHVQVVGY